MVAKREQINQVINSIVDAKNYQHKGESFTSEEQAIFDSIHLKKKDENNNPTNKPDLTKLRTTVEFLVNFKEAREKLPTENPGLTRYEDSKKLFNDLFQKRRTNTTAYQLVRDFFGKKSADI